MIRSGVLRSTDSTRTPSKNRKNKNRNSKRKEVQALVSNLLMTFSGEDPKLTNSVEYAVAVRCPWHGYKRHSLPIGVALRWPFRKR